MGSVDTTSVSETTTEPDISQAEYEPRSLRGSAAISPWQLLAIGLFLALSAPLYFMRAFVPDELWFYHDAVAYARIGTPLWLQPAHLGYGALFWSTYVGLLHTFGGGLSALFVLRAIAFCLVACVTGLICWAGRRNQSEFTWHALLLWMFLPMAWWSGKIASPEIPAYSLCIGAFLLVGSDRPKLQAAGWTLWGLAVGLKLTVLPTFPLLLLVAMQATGVMALVACTAAAAGFLIANPVLLMDPQSYLSPVFGAGTPISAHLDRLMYMLFSSYWEWDAIPSGGVFVHGITLGTALILGYLFVREVKAKSPQAAMAVGALLMTCAFVLLNLRSRFLVWYAFPIIAILPFLILRLPARRHTRLLLTLAVILQAVFGIPQIHRQYEAKLESARELATWASEQPSIRQILERWRADTLLDVFTAGKPASLTAPGVQNSPREPDSWLIIAWGPASLQAGNRRVAMVIGNRLAALNRGYDVLGNMRRPQWAGPYHLEDTAELPGARMYLFVRHAVADKQ